MALVDYQVEGHVARITINRPEAKNAINPEVACRLTDAWHSVRDNAEVRVAVLTGTGDVFCAGADLGRLIPLISGSRSAEDEWDERMLADRTILETALLREFDPIKPVIAAINGAAFAGGLGLVGAADIVISREDVQMSFSEVRIGVIPAIISVVCLPKLGAHHGMKLFLTGELFDGHQAVAMGLAHRAVPADQLHAAVEEEVAMINLGGPIAVQECKKLARRVPTLTTAEAFKETAEWSTRMFRSDEGAEGMASFREKRKPSWIAED